jgi:hypothetical protein
MMFSLQEGPAEDVREFPELGTPLRCPLLEERLPRTMDMYKWRFTGR